MSMIGKYVFNLGFFSLLLVQSGCGGDRASLDKTLSILTNASAGITGDNTLDKELEKIRSRHQLPALAAFISNDEVTLEENQVGLRAVGTNSAVANGDKWHVGSITKSMTSALAAVMVDEGIIQWNSTLVEVFPELSSQILQKYQDVELQQMLSHSAGIKAGLSTTDEHRIMQRLSQIDAPLSLREQRRLILPIVLDHDHGQTKGEFLYSNIGYLIAAAMMEKVSDASWSSQLRNKLFLPLGIDEFGLGSPSTPGLLDQPLGHLVKNQMYVSSDTSPLPEIVQPAGGVHISLSSLATYARFQLNGKQGNNDLMDQAVLNELYRERNDAGYSLGWYVDPEDNDGVIMHTGYNGAWLSMLVIDYKNTVSYFAVTNAGIAEGKTEANTAIQEAISMLRRRHEAFVALNN